MIILGSHSPHGLQRIVRVHERVYNVVHDHEPPGRSSVFGVGVPGIEQNSHVMIPETEAREEQYDQYLKFDLEEESYEKLINWSNPDLIIHSGAITNGNYCKENPELAFKINGLSVEKLIKSTKQNVRHHYRNQP